MFKKKEEKKMYFYVRYNLQRCTVFNGRATTHSVKFDEKFVISNDTKSIFADSFNDDNRQQSTSKFPEHFEVTARLIFSMFVRRFESVDRLSVRNGLDRPFLSLKGNSSVDSDRFLAYKPRFLLLHSASSCFFFFFSLLCHFPVFRA